LGERCYPEFINYVEELLLETPIEEITEMIKCYRDLYKINGEIWKLESDIRRGKEGELGLEEVGRRALAIRDINNKRISTQNGLIEKLGGYKNIKGQHASEDKK
jgi:hypothetical protein